MGCVPVISLLPVQSPEAEQVVAFVEDQLRTVDPLKLTTSGEARNDRVGMGREAEFTATFTESTDTASLVVQLKVKIASSVSGPIVSLPTIDLIPSQLPEAVHSSALFEDQLRVILESESTVYASLVKLIIGVLTVVAEVDGASPSLPPQPLRVNTKNKYDNRILIVKFDISYVPKKNKMYRKTCFQR